MSRARRYCVTSGSVKKHQNFLSLNGRGAQQEVENLVSVVTAVEQFTIDASSNFSVDEIRRESRCGVRFWKSSMIVISSSSALSNSDLQMLTHQAAESDLGPESDSVLLVETKM